MKKLIIAVCLLFSIQAGAQELNKKKQDPSHNKEVMINTCTRAGIMEFPEFKTMYDAIYPDYKPDSVALTALMPFVQTTTITVVMGTWCGDSKLQVPHFYKIVDALGIPEKNITLICVDGDKKAENGLIDNLNIERVPTFIFSREGKELGRIIESPRKSLEQDMLAILTKK